MDNSLESVGGIPALLLYSLLSILIGYVIGTQHARTETAQSISVQTRTLSTRGEDADLDEDRIMPRRKPQSDATPVYIPQESSSDDGGSDGSDSDNESDEEYCKMVLVVRTDLGMTKGKAAAQCCHACLAAYTVCVESHPQVCSTCQENINFAVVDAKVGARWTSKDHSQVRQ